MLYADRVCRLYAWSTAFLNKLNYVRNEQELKTLRKIGAAANKTERRHWAAVNADVLGTVR